jgi:putative ABC transport system ATP-binding protein
VSLPVAAAVAPARRMVELSGVSRSYEGRRTVHALRDVSLTVDSGEMVALMGPSGSGKSTLLNIVGGLDSPTAGTVKVDGVEITGLDDDARTRLRRDRIGFVFQFFNLFPTLTAAENVAFPLHLSGTPRRVARARASEMLGTVGLAEREEHLPDELSGGEQQRVAIARALVGRPSLVLADEPTGNLDSKTGAEILALLHRLRARFGAIIVLVTHDSRAAQACERVVRMRDGRIAGAESDDAPPHPADQPS